MLGLSAAAAAAFVFRPPAIPLITADPFMQTFIMGDTSTSDAVKMWDSQSKAMLGLLRVDNQTYRFLGECSRAMRPGQVEEHADHNLAPGKCDISNTIVRDRVECNARCYGTFGCKGFVLNSDRRCYLKSCAGPLTAENGTLSGVLVDPSPACGGISTAPPALLQRGVAVFPTRTVFTLELPGTVGLNLTFLQTAFTDDPLRLSRPVYYVTADVAPLDGQPHAVQLYMDMGADHTVNDCYSEEVGWGSWEARGASAGDEVATTLSGVRIGKAAPQDVLGMKCDTCKIDWGYLHLAVSPSPSSSLYAGSAATARAAFAEGGRLPAAHDPAQPRNCGDALPSLVVAHDFGTLAGRSPAAHTLGGGGATSTFTCVIGYDDVASVYYFGERLKGLWTHTYATIQDAMAAAAGEHAAMLSKSVAHDADLSARLCAKAGRLCDEYASLGALAYRQTLAALKPVWSASRSDWWVFLKEISTNGDMQTMDVIYPASPMLLYTSPDLLRRMLLPVLAYAANETSIKYGSPYSPHQLGTYPIGNDTTAEQEPMPLENSGNMLFMLLALAQRQGGAAAAEWIGPYLPLLRRWADELVRTAEFPADQLCTDDFTGKLTNNTNLGAKGTLAIRAFAELCALVAPGARACDGAAALSGVADKYARTWQAYAYTASPSPHYKMSFNPVRGVNDSWSLKYNLLWQRLLRFDPPPFPDHVIRAEVAYYKAKANPYGVPLDPRHSWVKTDWLSWVAALGETTEEWATLFAPIFRFANTTSSRHPFTDLYDTQTGLQSWGSFIARPVIGGIFAKMLLP